MSYAHGKICYVESDGVEVSGAVVDAVTMMGPMRIARIRDPHGNIFGLYEGPRES